MGLPTTFGGLSSATGAELDNNFQAVGALTTLQCTASGTNAITLTPAANAPAVNAYGLPNPVRFGFIAVANSTSSVTLAITGLGFLPLYLPTGSQAGNGSISNGSYYEVVWLQALNSGGGGFIIVSAIPPTGSTVSAPPRAQNLAITNNSGTPSTKISITAASTVMVSSVGLPIYVSSASVTIDLTTNGANGMDTGSRPTSGWVYLYLISNGSVTAGLASATSPTSGGPTLPGGYTYTAYVGAMFCDGSQNLMRTLQKGRRAQYTVTAATNTATLPNMVNGVQGTYSATTPTWQSVAVGSFVPATAGAIGVVNDTGWKANTASAVQLAPNNSYGGYQNASGNLPLIDTNAAILTTWFELESTSIYVTANNAGGAFSCLGWEDSFSCG